MNALNTNNPRRKSLNQSQIITPKPKQNYTFIRLVLSKNDGGVYANKEFKLIVDGVEFTGKTDSQGLVEKSVPENSKHGKLIFKSEKGDFYEAIELELE